ncbi:hypothetical protein NMY22_g8311 [Coprinellus aureogranulatus]|nr:hypothetical protein NMY22_g8311 [Coprinellus aureogranulatus]
MLDVRPVAPLPEEEEVMVSSRQPVPCDVVSDVLPALPFEEVEDLLGLFDPQLSREDEEGLDRFAELDTCNATPNMLPEWPFAQVDDLLSLLRDTQQDLTHWQEYQPQTPSPPSPPTETDADVPSITLMASMASRRPASPKLSR